MKRTVDLTFLAENLRELSDEVKDAAPFVAVRLRNMSEILDHAVPRKITTTHERENQDDHEQQRHGAH